MSEGTDWLDQARRLVAGLGQTWTEAWAEVRTEAREGSGAGQGGHVPGGDCRWCPVCQLAVVARRPEVSAALADVLTTAAAALRAVADAEPDPGPGAPTGPDAGQDRGPGADTPAAAPPAAPVQHIEIG
ncbi:hypothetical protein [Geodermatophilus sp. URMC 62]|uniref:hypothetical protein n=1 Tax=Geodermatophilus sp. URMC 62 TaxID=3423414 RepID=UPI00406CAD5A